MYKATLFLCLVLLSGCVMNNKSRLMLDWKEGGVLPKGGQGDHIGIAGPVTGVMEDRLIIAGGANFPNGMPWDGGKKTYQKEAYIFKIDAEGKLILEMIKPFADSIAYSANTSANGYIYSIGGERSGVASADVWRYSLVNNELVREALPSLPVPLTNGAAVYLNGALYMIGGENTDQVSDKVYRLQVSNGTSMWEQFAVLKYPLSHAMVVADSGQHIVILGGRMRNDNATSKIYDQAYMLNTQDRSLTSLPVLPYPLAAGTAIFYNNSVILFGGDSGTTFNRVEELIAAINLSKDDRERDELTKQKNLIQREHPGFGKEVWALDLITLGWSRLADIEGDSPVTTTAVLKDDLVIIPSGEIRAGVRTNKILVGQIK